MLHMRLDVELLRAVRVLHCDEHFRVKVWNFAAAAKLNALHGENGAELPPQNKADVAVSAIDVANHRESVVGTRVHYLYEVLEGDGGGKGDNGCAHRTADRRDVRFP